MEGQISAAVMDERLQRLQALINTQQRAFNEAIVGKTTSILLERKGKLPGQLIGKSPWLQSVHVFADENKIGDMIAVEIESAGGNSLAGVSTRKEIHVA
jgi:tRNA-2-methylthio-N6-dimethylallyladenosine synthase